MNDGKYFEKLLNWKKFVTQDKYEKKKPRKFVSSENKRWTLKGSLIFSPFLPNDTANI